MDFTSALDDFSNDRRSFPELANLTEHGVDERWSNRHDETRVAHVHGLDQLLQSARSRTGVLSLQPQIFSKLERKTSSLR